MKIFYNNEMLDIPVWITVSDNSVQITNRTAKINDRHGEVSFGESVYSTRSFNCSGTIFAEKYEDVEKERSRLTSILTGRELKVYRDDDDKIFYLCRLIGSIKINYNHGIELAKVFNISFMLKALDPFGSGELQEKAVIGGNKTIAIQNDGNYITSPTVEIDGVDSVEGLLIECNNSFLEVNKKIIIPTGQKLTYKDGLLYLKGDDISVRLSNKAVINPLYFVEGENKIKIKTSGNIKFIFNARYK